MPSGIPVTDEQRIYIAENSGKFPSQIAKDLGIAIISVRRALKQIEAEKEGCAT
jgi:hypothetical protein